MNSDMDYRDLVFGLPESEILERQVEQRRFDDEEALKDVFLRHLPHAAAACAEMFAYTCAYAEEGSARKAARDFAGTYGWPAVFRVLSGAIQHHDDLIARR